MAAVDPDTGEVMEGAPDDFVYMARGMSISRLHCDPAQAKTQMRPVLCATLVGEITGTEEKTDPKTMQVFHALKGVFRAINEQTGTKYISGLCFLPGSWQGMTLDGLKSATPDQLPIEIELAIWAVPSSAPNGYSYEARSLKTKSVPDRLEQRLLEARRDPARLAIAAPPQSSLTAPGQ